MSNYRRNFLPGGTFFFTANLRNRKSDMLIKNVNNLRNSFKHVQREKPFFINAIVILPDHIHTIWTLPIKDKDYVTRWRMIKSHFTRACKEKGMQIQKNKRGENFLWQPRYWEHTIRDEKDLENHANYIHYNPVKHELTSSVREWPYSSFHRYVTQGLLAPDWAGNANEFKGTFGE